MLHWLHANQVSSQSKQRRTGLALGRKGLNVKEMKVQVNASQQKPGNQLWEWILTKATDQKRKDRYA